MQNDFLPQDETVYANTQLYEIYAEPSPEPQKRSKKKLRWGRIFCFALLLAAVLAVFSLLRGEETVADLSTLPPQDICIVLDAGHGGRDNGSSAEGVLEKDLNLQMILQLGENLKKKAIRCFLPVKRTDLLNWRKELLLRTGKRHIFSFLCIAIPSPMKQQTGQRYIIMLRTARNFWRLQSMILCCISLAPKAGIIPSEDIQCFPTPICPGY